MIRSGEGEAKKRMAKRQKNLFSLKPCSPRVGHSSVAECTPGMRRAWVPPARQNQNKQLPSPSPLQVPQGNAAKVGAGPCSADVNASQKTWLGRSEVRSLPFSPTGPRNGQQTWMGVAETGTYLLLTRKPAWTTDHSWERTPTPCQACSAWPTGWHLLLPSPSSVPTEAAGARSTLERQGGQTLVTPADLPHLPIPGLQVDRHVLPGPWRP